MFVYVLLFSSMKGTINGKDGCGEVYDTPEQCVCIYKNNQLKQETRARLEGDL